MGKVVFWGHLSPKEYFLLFFFTFIFLDQPTWYLVRERQISVLQTAHSQKTAKGANHQQPAAPFRTWQAVQRELKERQAPFKGWSLNSQMGEDSWHWPSMMGTSDLVCYITLHCTTTQSSKHWQKLLTNIQNNLNSPTGIKYTFVSLYFCQILFVSLLQGCFGEGWVLPPFWFW